MKKMISRRAFMRAAGITAAAAAVTTAAPAASAASFWPFTMDLQILATSDTHGKFDPWDYAANKEDTSGSVAQQAAAIKQLRTPDTLVIDAGDTIQGNSSQLFLEDDIHPMVAAMNAIGYDIWVPGNHEYNYGMDVLQKVMAQQKAQVLTGNVYAPDGTPPGQQLHHPEKAGCPHWPDRHGHPQYHPLGCGQPDRLDRHQPCG